MEIIKLSLVATLLIGSSAMALENTKFTGDANLFYHTQDKADGNLATGDGGLLEAQNSAADMALNFNVATDLLKNDAISISAGAGYTVLTTLGLENNLVGNVWGGAHTATAGTGAAYGGAVGGAKVEDAAWVNEAWVAGTAGKTTVKLGRMELDTPLVYTEKWSIERNTFEAAVAINQDIPNTTLVGAFIGNGNGNETMGQNLQSNVQALNLAVGAVANRNGEFGTFGTDGAYAVGAINNSWKPLSVQAWYYDVTRVATAAWLQADLNMDGILVGAQYASLTGAASGADTGTAFAGMIGYEMKDIATVKIAYSQTGADAGAGANVATATGRSKLYTEAQWNFGYVTRADTSSLNLAVEGNLAGIDLGVHGTMSQQNNGSNMNEGVLTAAKSVGPVDLRVAYIYANSTRLRDVSDYTNSLQAFVTFNF